MPLRHQWGMRLPESALPPKVQLEKVAIPRRRWVPCPRLGVGMRRPGSRVHAQAKTVGTAPGWGIMPTITAGFQLRLRGWGPSRSITCNAPIQALTAGMDQGHLMQAQDVAGFFQRSDYSGDHYDNLSCEAALNLWQSSPWEEQETAFTQGIAQRDDVCPPKLALGTESAQLQLSIEEPGRFTLRLEVPSTEKWFGLIPKPARVVHHEKLTPEAGTRAIQLFYEQDIERLMAGQF